MTAISQSRPLDIDILPERYRPRRVSAQTLMVIMAIAALLLGLIPAYAFLVAERDRTADLQARLAQAKEALAEAQANPGQLEEVNRQIEQTRAQVTSIQEALGMLSQRQAPRSACVSAPVVALASGVRIISVTQDGDNCTVTGEADSQNLALNYARAIRSTGQFATVLIVWLNEAESSPPVIEFAIRMEQ